MKWTLAALLVAGAALAQTPEQDIRTVISDQIAAFQADDVTAAFDHASPMIQSIFGTAENFGRMVQQGYPMVWAPEQVTFAGVEPGPRGLVQKVLFRDAQGALHIAEYEMIQTTGDAWKINGVRILQNQTGA